MRDSPALSVRGLLLSAIDDELHVRGSCESFAISSGGSILRIVLDNRLALREELGWSDFSKVLELGRQVLSFNNDNI